MAISRRKFIRSAAAGSAAFTFAANVHGQSSPSSRSAPYVAPKGLARPPRRPNLLFLWTDQHRGDAVPWTANSAVKAPNFFAPLGERSFVFQRAYVTQPVCSPSRASVLTGLWPHNHGTIRNNIPLRSDVRTIAEYLSDDYATAYYGKWHLGNEITAQHGFRDWRSIEYYRHFYTNPKDLERFPDYHHFLVEKGFPPDRNDDDGPHPVPIFSRQIAAAMPESYTKVAFLADEAVKFLNARRDGQPFVLHVNSLEPHPPMYGPLNEAHDPDEMPAGPAFARPVDAEASLLVRNKVEAIRTGTDGFVKYNHPKSPAVSGRSRVTADRWKLNLYHDDVPELFDLRSDPGELHNLAGNPAHRDRVRRLTDEIRAWQEQTGDKLLLQFV